MKLIDAYFEEQRWFPTGQNQFAAWVLAEFKDGEPMKGPEGFPFLGAQKKKKKKRKVVDFRRCWTKIVN